MIVAQKLLVSILNSFFLQLLKLFIFSKISYRHDSTRNEHGIIQGFPHRRKPEQLQEVNTYVIS